MTSGMASATRRGLGYATVYSHVGIALGGCLQAVYHRLSSLAYTPLAVDVLALTWLLVLVPGVARDACSFVGHRHAKL